MQRNHIQKIFDTWRKENRHRFTYRTCCDSLLTWLKRSKCLKRKMRH